MKIVAIIALLILGITMLFLKVDSQLLFVVIAVIAGLAGYEVLKRKK